MNFFVATVLGILQGLTEFLPVSSSGHLVIAQHFFDIQVDAGSLLAFDVLLHMATLLALVWVYRLRWLSLATGLWKRENAAIRLLGLLIIGTLPAVVVGFLLKNVLTEHARSLSSVAVGLLITACVLIVAERSRKRASIAKMTLRTACFIGLGQACALVPGVSRSGTTIATGRTTGLSAPEALDFSFLLATSAIAGASVLVFFEFFQGSVVMPETPVMLAGFFSSLLSSVGAIYLLRTWVRRMALSWFAAYLIPMALALLFVGM